MKENTLSLEQGKILPEGGYTESRTGQDTSLDRLRASNEKIRGIRG